MQFLVTTDYTFRVIMYLADKPREIVTGGEIAGAMGIPINYIKSLTKNLKDKGIIETYAGQKGGYKIIKDPSLITAADIITAVEGKTVINRCMEAEKFCSRNATQGCPVRKMHENAQHLFLKEYEKITISDLLCKSINT